MQPTTEICIKVDDIDRPNDPSLLWDNEKFTNRLYLMRELYQDFMSIGYLEVSLENDPFYDPPEEQLIGRALIYLDPLSYLLEVEEATPIIDYKGQQKG